MYTILLSLLLIGDHDHHAATLPQSTLPMQQPQSTLPPRKLTYEEARSQAIAEGKPLVVWSGSAVCPACVQTLSGDVVSYVGPVRGLPANAIIVAMPDGRGDVLQVNTITEWITGDATFGHVPSVRRAVRRYRETGHTSAGGWSLEAPVARPMAAPVMQPTMQPMMYRPAMVRRGGG